MNTLAVECGACQKRDFTKEDILRFAAAKLKDQDSTIQELRSAEKHLIVALAASTSDGSSQPTVPRNACVIHMPEQRASLSRSLMLSCPVMLLGAFLDGTVFDISEKFATLIAPSREDVIGTSFCSCCCSLFSVCLVCLSHASSLGKSDPSLPLP